MKTVAQQLAKAIRKDNPEEYRDMPEAADRIAEVILKKFDVVKKPKAKKDEPPPEDPGQVIASLEVFQLPALKEPNKGSW